MKPRTVLLCIAAVTLGILAACSGVNVSLGGGHSNPVAMAGNTDTGGSDASTAGNGGGGGSLIIDNNDPVPCAANLHTSISGTVFDPAGNTPLYNAVVYIPAGDLPSFHDAVACETCPEPVKATADALSGADGSFVLTDVPNVKHVDLVVQLGKWRRKQHVSITPCQDNPLTKDDTRLPRNRTDSNAGVADLPKIALSTGHSDALECLLRKIGVSDSEFTTDSGGGRVNLFVGCVNDNGDRFGANHFATNLGGATFPSTNQLFDSGELSTFDMVIFSCEGHKCDKDNGLSKAIQTPDHIAKLVDYANAGGRVYLDHDHYNWLNHSNVAIEKAAQFSSMTPDGGIPDSLTTKINTVGFPKGESFAQWLLDVGASKTLGTLDIHTARTSVESLSPNRAQSWIYRDQDPIGFFYFTIGTPVAEKDSDPAPAACGRVVFTDLHVSSTDGGDSGDISDQDFPFPSGCVSPVPMMTAQEKALEFMIFDLSSCVQKETDTPMPPPVVVK